MESLPLPWGIGPRLCVFLSLPPHGRMPGPAPRLPSYLMGTSFISVPSPCDIRAYNSLNHKTGGS